MREDLSMESRAHDESVQHTPKGGTAVSRIVPGHSA